MPLLAEQTSVVVVRVAVDVCVEVKGVIHGVFDTSTSKCEQLIVQITVNFLLSE